VPIGVDPQLVAVRAAQRVARQLGVDAHFICADARFIPLRSVSVDAAFSYSVLQHFAKDDARAALRELARVLRPGGRVLVQMPNTFGLRCLQHQARRRFREATAFEVRYWRPAELRAAFTDVFGPAELFVDGFFTINPQPADAHLLPWKFRMVVWLSETLRQLSDRLPVLAHVADSLYVSARRVGAGVAVTPDVEPQLEGGAFRNHSIA
jgi:SAM-dependent methyltransferase